MPGKPKKESNGLGVHQRMSDSSLQGNNNVNGSDQQELIKSRDSSISPCCQNGISPGITIESQKLAMKKRLGPISGMAIIVGTMIGSGIFISPQYVLMGTGSVGLSLIVWVACGILCTLGSLAYAELGTMITKSGGEYPYLLETFGPMHRFLGPIPAYLFAWVSIIVLRPAAYAIIALSFGTYATERFFGDCGAPSFVTKLASVLCILLVTFLNCYSVKLATQVQTFFTAAKLLAMSIITIGGFVKIAQGNTEYLETGFEGTADLSTIALAFYVGLWAYDGWNSLNFVTEEIQNPSKNLPRSILFGLPLVTLFYLFTNISYLTVISKQELIETGAVAATWGDRVLGVASFIIPLSVALSTFGAANGTCFTAGRLCYSAAREGHMLEFLSYVHVRKLTPLPSLVFTTLISIMMIVMGDIFSLIDFFSFLSWFIYGLTMVCLLILRKTRPYAHRPYKVPLIVPIVVLIASCYLVVAPIISQPRVQFLYAVLFVVGGLVFYVPFVYCKIRLSCMDQITYFFQVLFESVPSKYEG